MHDETKGGLLAADSPPEPGLVGDPIEAVQVVADVKARAESDNGGDPPAPADPEAGGGTVTEDEYGTFAWPEGYAADPEAVAKFIPLARKLGLPKEGAQELALLYAELDQRRHRDQAEFVARNNSEWLREIETHPEFGGRNLEPTADGVARLMRRFGSPLLVAQIRQMNVQNWPEMFYFLARVAQASGEDCSPSGVGGAEPSRSTAQLLFPGLK